MKSRAFSFVEVMFALVILSISLIVLSQSQIQSMNLMGKARSLDYATQLAEMRIAELTMQVQEKGIESLKDTEQGEFDQEAYPTYRWIYRVKPVPAPNFQAMMGAMGGTGGSEEDLEGTNADALRGPLSMISKVWGEALRDLEVEILWGPESRPKSYSLRTHLISPNATLALQAALSSLTQMGGGG